MGEKECGPAGGAEDQTLSLDPSFYRIVETFGVQAMVWTGQVPNPVDEQKTTTNLELAKYQIGLLEVLEKKTKGNLDKDEENFLGEWLHAARLAFIRAKDRLDKECASQRPPTEKAEG